MTTELQRLTLQHEIEMEELIARAKAGTGDPPDSTEWREGERVRRISDSDMPANLSPALQNEVNGLNNAPDLGFTKLAIDGPGYTWMYDRVTGDPSRARTDTLAFQLRKKSPDTGELMFQLNDPGFRPKRGTIKCYLHAKSQQRAQADEWALPVCKQGSIPNTSALLDHMKHRHSREFGMFQIRDQEAKEARQEEYQRLVMAKALNVDVSELSAAVESPKAEEPSEPVAAPAPVAVEPAPQKKEAKMILAPCRHPGCVKNFDQPGPHAYRLRIAHEQKAHGMDYRKQEA